jgi:hypothetical protein
VAKTVKIQSTFEVIDASGNQDIRKVTRDELSIEEGSAYFPVKIAASTTDYPVNFEGVALGKRIFIRSDQAVTLKVQNQGDAGFPFGPGDGWLPSTAGITGMWVTTGPVETRFEAIVVGD